MGLMFRPHRGSLDDSMSDIVELPDMDALIQMIEEYLSPYKHGLVINRDTVKVEKYYYDERIKWDTHIVSLENYGVIGFLNGNFE